VLLTAFRKHVLQDLEPYICTFSTCGLEGYQSQHTWFEHELLVHRNQWVCSRCSDPFASSDSLERHINQHHSESISGRQIRTIIEQSKRPIESIQPSECPFCDSSWAKADQSDTTTEGVLVVDLDQFRRHLGHHLQQVALFSLPRLDQDQDVGSNDVGGIPGRDALSKGCRWVRDDCGRGWSIISRKRTAFIAFAYFLALYRNQNQSSNPEQSEGLPKSKLNSNIDDFDSFSSLKTIKLSTLAEKATPSNTDRPIKFIELFQVGPLPLPFHTP